MPKDHIIEALATLTSATSSALRDQAASLNGDDLLVLAALTRDGQYAVSDDVRLATESLYLGPVWRGELGTILMLPGANLDPHGYPEAAREALIHGKLLWASDTDFVLVWRGGVYHAHTTGFWCVARSAAAWLDEAVRRVKTGASPELIRSRTDAFVRAAGASSYLLVTGEGRGVDFARQLETVADPARRLAQVGAAAPGWTWTLSTRKKHAVQGAAAFQEQTAIFEGEGEALSAQATALVASLGGQRYELWGRRDARAPDGWLRIVDGARAAELQGKIAALPSLKRRGGVALLGVSSAASEASGGALELEGPIAAPALKARMQELVRGSAAKAFTVETSAAGTQETTTGLAQKKLLRMSSALSQRLAGGGRLRLWGEGIVPPAPVAALWV